MPTAPPGLRFVWSSPDSWKPWAASSSGSKLIALAPLRRNSASRSRKRLRSAASLRAQLLGRHEVAVGDDVAELGALGGGLGERGQRSRELRAVLAERPGDLAAAAQDEVLAQREVGQGALPRRGPCGRRRPPRAAGRTPPAPADPRRPAPPAPACSRRPVEARRAQPAVQRLEAGPIAARAPGHDLLARQVLERRERRASPGRSPRSRGHRSRNGGEKSTICQPLGRDGQVRGGDVAHAGDAGRAAARRAPPARIPPGSAGRRSGSGG